MLNMSYILYTTLLPHDFSITKYCNINPFSIQIYTQIVVLPLIKLNQSTLQVTKKENIFRFFFY